MTYRLKTLLALGTVLPALFHFSQCFAADAPTDGSTEATSVSGVIVTATRTGAVNIQKVPAAITAINTSALTTQGAQGLSDYLSSVPALYMEQQGPGESQIVIRGLSTGAYNLYYSQDHPLVAVYLDEVPISLQGDNPELHVLDLERIEVLRGPQGTLYGDGSMAGTIRMVTKKPDSTQFYGTLDTQLSGTEGGGANYNVAGIANVPLVSDRLALQVGGYAGYESGWIDNVGTRQPDANFNHDYQARVALRWTPSNRLTFDLSYLYSNLKTNSNDEVLNPGAVVNGIKIGNNQFYSLEPDPYKDALNVLNFTGTWASDNFTLVSSTSYLYRDFTATQVVDLYNQLALGLPVTLPSRFDLNSKVANVSEELRLYSPDRGALRWSVGTFIQNYDRHQDQEDPSPGFDAAWGSLIGDPTFSSVSYSAPANNLYHRLAHTTEEQEALFGELTYKPIEKLTLTAGLRAFWWSDHFDEFVGGFFGELTQGVPIVASDSSNEHGLNPRFVASYQINSNSMLFVEAAKGFRYGGSNIPLPNTCLPAVSPIAFGPDSLWSYSLGSKNQFFDHRVTLNVTADLIYWSNVQQRVFAPCGLSYVVDEGNIRSEGLELESSWAVTDNFTLGLNGSYTNAVANGAIAGLGAANGERAPYSPREIAYAGADYRIPAGEADVLLHGDYTFTGDVTTTFSPAAEGYHDFPARNSLNLAITYKRSKWQLGVFARNVLNDRAVTDIYSPFAGYPVTTYVGRPTTVGIDFKVRN